MPVRCATEAKKGDHTAQGSPSRTVEGEALAACITRSPQMSNPETRVGDQHIALTVKCIPFPSRKYAQFTLQLGGLVIWNNICSERSSFGSLQTTQHWMLRPANTITVEAFHSASQPLGGELLTWAQCCVTSAVGLALWTSWQILLKWGGEQIKCTSG